MTTMKHFCQNAENILATHDAEKNFEIERLRALVLRQAQTIEELRGYVREQREKAGLPPGSLQER